MDLIYADHSDFAPILAQILSEESLWRNEKHLDLFVSDCLEHSLLGREALLRIDARTWHEVRQFAKLISHQSQERRDNENEARHELGAILVHERFTTASREYNEGIVLLLDDNLDSFKLSFHKFIVTESFL